MRRIDLAKTKLSQSRNHDYPREAGKLGTSQPIHFPCDPVSQLQRVIGNRAVQRLFESAPAQAKIPIGRQRGVHEQEARRVEAEVSGLPQAGVELKKNPHGALNPIGVQFADAEPPATTPPEEKAECTVSLSNPAPGFRKRRGISSSPKHDGVDIATPAGTSIKAAADGTVVHAGEYNGYGRTVDIDHCGKYTTRYAHLSEYISKKGNSAKKGEEVAVSGNSGRSTGPHLHFEIREGGPWGTVLDPESFITFSS